MNNKRNQLKTGAVMSYFAIIFDIVAGLIYTPLMVRKIGQSDYGLFTLATAFLSYILMDFGLGNAITRYISKYRAENNNEKIYNFLGITVKLYTILSVIILVILTVAFFFIENIFLKLTVEEFHKFKVVYIIIGLYSVISFPFTPLNGILNSFEEFFYFKLCDVINRVLTISFMIIVLMSGAKLYGLVAVNAFVGIVIILIKLFIIIKKIPLKINFKYWDKSFLKELLFYSVWTTVIVIAQTLLVNIAPTVLGMVSGALSISIYSLGRTIQGYVWLLANALNGLFMPKVARISQSGNSIEQTNDLMIKVGRIQLFILGAIIIGFISFGKEFIHIWMGESFGDSYYVAVLLIVPNIIALTQGIANTKLFVVGEVKYRASIFIVASIISVIITFILAPSLGAIGAAIGIFTAMMLCHVFGMNVVYYLVLKIDIKKFFKECHLNMAIPLIISLGIGLYMQYLFPMNSFTGFIPKVIVFGMFYIVLMWIISLKPYEKELFLGALRKIMIFTRRKREVSS